MAIGLSCALYTSLLSQCPLHHSPIQSVLRLLARFVFPGAYAAKLIDETQRFDITRNACPGAGACGGMYTANTMSSAIEAMGMSLPYSSSVPAEDPLKKLECRLAGRQVLLLLLL